VEIRDYVILQKPRDLTDCLPPPRMLILDFTLTHTRFGKSQLSSMGQLTHTRRTDNVPEPDGDLKTVTRAKIRHYRQLNLNRPDPIAFMPVAVDTSGRVYDDFSRLLFLHDHREASALVNEIPEESEQFRFLRAACYANIKGSVVLILAKASAMWISIPLDLSSRSFIPPSCFMRSRRVATLLAPSLVFTPRKYEGVDRTARSEPFHLMTQLVIKYGNIVLTTTTDHQVWYHLYLLLLVRLGGYIVNLSDFYSVTCPTSAAWFSLNRSFSQQITWLSLRQKLYVLRLI
jgi:hypothetical protein